MRDAMPPARELDVSEITRVVRDLFIAASRELGGDVAGAIEEALSLEESERAVAALREIMENQRIAREESMPLCQDTGLAVLFVEIGQDVRIRGGVFHEALQEGVRLAYREGYLRKSVCDPLSRVNTADNTPAVIHVDIVPGDRVRITAMPKGGGSENMSVARMLVPSSGLEGIEDLVVDTVRKAGPNSCPPLVVGVGIGGTLEYSALLAKKALARPLGRFNDRDDRLADLERKLLERINGLGIGAQGYGGRVTALAVHAEMVPCHIASLPVTVNLNCHVARHRECIL